MRSSLLSQNLNHVKEHRLFIGGEWVVGGPMLEVTNKYSGEVIGAVPTARRQEVDAALVAAERAAPLMAGLPAHERARILARTSEAIRDRGDEFASTIAAEAGKALKWARIEVDRAVSTFSLAGEEARRIHGETVPLDERVDVGPMIAEAEALRIEGWVEEATAAGAELLTGGIREGPVYHPTVLVSVSRGLRPGGFGHPGR